SVRRRIAASNCGNLSAVHDPAIGFPPGDRSGRDCPPVPNQCYFILNCGPDPYKSEQTRRGARRIRCQEAHNVSGTHFGHIDARKSFFGSRHLSPADTFLLPVCLHRRAAALQWSTSSNSGRDESRGESCWIGFSTAPNSCRVTTTRPAFSSRLAITGQCRRKLWPSIV